MKLEYPIKPAVQTQPFGVNGAWYQAHGIDIIGHNGIDFFAYHGQPIYASHDGKAVYSIDPSGGCGVTVSNTDLGIKTIYWHFVDGRVEPKYKSPIGVTEVKTGDLLGYADSTGLSTGDHLHFGLKFINSEGETLNQDNGYKGAINPEPYFGKFVFTKSLWYGCTTPFPSLMSEVRQLQMKLGMSPADSFGLFGPKTKQAVQAFQTKHGLFASGIVGPQTRKLLNTS